MKDDDVSGQVVSTIVTCLVTTFLKKFDKDVKTEIVNLSNTELKIHKKDGTTVVVRSSQHET